MIVLSLNRRPTFLAETCTVYPTLLRLWLALSGRAARKSPPRRRPPFRHPLVEALEDRTLLSTLTVLNNLDSGAGSLRDAISRARSGDTIVFAPSLVGQTITLTSDQLTINKSLDIEGPGASLLAISGNNTNRVFNINEGLTVTIADLTITDGRAEGANVGEDGGGGGGGGILNVGSTLTLARDVLSYNVDLGGANQAQGGAIDNIHLGATLTVTDSEFIGNQADGRAKNSRFAEGGAIYNSPNGSSVTVIRCTFVGNQVMAGNGLVATSTNLEVGEANGGALHNEGSSTLTVEDSTFTGNQAIGGSGGIVGKNASVYNVDGAFGGGIANDDGGTLVVSGSTFSHNQAIGGSNGTCGSSGQGVLGVGAGGALGSIAQATVVDSTFDHNEALGGSGNLGGSGFSVIGRGVGGAIQNVNFEGSSATLFLSDCSFTNNQAVGGVGNTGGTFAGEGIGGGLSNQRGATATVTGSTFTGNQAIGGAGVPGGKGGDGLGGGIANMFGSSLTVNNCMLNGNQVLGGAGGVGGNGFGGGIYNDGLSIDPANSGTPSTMTVTGSTITSNAATGGTAGTGGSAGAGIGGGSYFASGGVVCLDAATVANILGNTASTSNNDIFGVYTIC
jgi:hypothetical protein